MRGCSSSRRTIGSERKRRRYTAREFRRTMVEVVPIEKRQRGNTATVMKRMKVSSKSIIVYQLDSSGLNFIKDLKRGFRSSTLYTTAILNKRTDLSLIKKKKGIRCKKLFGTKKRIKFFGGTAGNGKNLTILIKGAINRNT